MGAIAEEGDCIEVKVVEMLVASELIQHDMNKKF